MRLRDEPLRQVLAYFAWVCACAAVLDFWIFKLSMGPWTGTLVQVLGDVVTVVPILVFSPATLRTLPAPRAQLVLGLGLVCLAALDSALVDRYHGYLIQEVIAYASTGFGEELAFRGFIWERLRLAGLSSVALVAADDALFVAWHLVGAAAGGVEWSALIGVAVFGALFGVVRLRVGNTGLPALLHWAVDLANL